MAVEWGNSAAAAGATSNDSPSTFEQSTLGGTTTTTNARLIVRTADQIDVIDTNNYWASENVEGVLTELALLSGVDNSSITAQLDAITDRLDINEPNIATNTTNISSNDTDIATNVTDIATNVTDIATNVTDIATNVTDIAALAYKNAGFNYIINGAMEVRQRGDNFVAPVNGKVTLDQWKSVWSNIAVRDIGVSSDFPNNANRDDGAEVCLRWDCTTVDTSEGASDEESIRYVMEGYDYSALAAGDATLSFWVKTNKTGVYCVSYRNAALDRSYVSEYTVNSADTWEKKVITVDMDAASGTWSTSTGIGLYIDFSLMSGSNSQTTKDAWQTGSFTTTTSQVNLCDSTSNYISLTDIKMEAGSVATRYEKESYVTEIAKCRRYFQTVENVMWSGDVTNVNTYYTTINFDVSMRAVPTAETLTNGSQLSFGTTVTVWNLTLTGVSFQRVATATGTGFYYQSGTFTAEL